MEKKLLVLLALIFVISFDVWANNVQFDKNKQEIIQSWTKRSWKTKSIQKPKMKTICVMAVNTGQPIIEKIEILENDQEGTAKIKVEFAVDSYEIRPEAQGILMELGEAMSDNRMEEWKFIINGHTDSDGEEQYNLRLSFQRARSVRDFLSSHFGFNGNKLKIRGFGEYLPLVDNTSDMNKQINRRVEIKATKDQAGKLSSSGIHEELDEWK